jgi:probable phosphoglycerate mutase
MLLLCFGVVYGWSMSTRIYLIRHGATTLSAEDRFAGATDVDLSEEGRAQARALADRLGDQKIARIYASPMKRTMETASIVGTPLGLSPEPRAGLKEIDHGRWEQLTRKEVETRFAAEYEAWEADPFTVAPVGGESGASVMARALPALREIVVAHPNSTVAVVSHKATIRLMLCALLGIDARGYRDRLDQSPCGLNLVEFKDPTRARLMLYNDISHYAPAHASAGGRLSKWWDKKV